MWSTRFLGFLYNYIYIYIRNEYLLEKESYSVQFSEVFQSYKDTTRLYFEETAMKFSWHANIFCNEKNIWN